MSIKKLPNYTKLDAACKHNGLHLEISRTPRERQSREFFNGGKSNFSGWIVRVVKKDKRICRARMQPEESFDDIAIDLYAFLKKEKYV